MSPGFHNPPLSESDTRSKLIDPAIQSRGWTEEHIRREETAATIEIIDEKPRRRSKGRVDLDDAGITIDDIMVRNPVDAITGQRVTCDQLKAMYEATSYETQVMLPDQVEAMCRDLFKYLIDTGGEEQKSVIICARGRDQTEMTNLGDS